MKILPKTAWISVAGLALMLVSGCQCFPAYNTYANAVDDINDTHLYFDRFYNPRFDVTRMGKPDWASSPINRFLCRRCAVNGTYDKYDECNQYPPLWPFEFPSHLMPAPIYRTKRPAPPTDADDMAQPSDQAPLPTPGSVSSPTEDQ